MKKAEQLEKMDLEQLMALSGDESIAVPAGLGSKIEAGLLAAAASERSQAKPARLRPWVPALGAAFASVAALLIVLGAQPKDSFSDPALAYAEVEKTFGLISAKLSQGENAAQQAAQTFNELINVKIK